MKREGSILNKPPPPPIKCSYWQNTQTPFKIAFGSLAGLAQWIQCQPVV